VISITVHSNQCSLVTAAGVRLMGYVLLLGLCLPLSPVTEH
jgi:hypothetical protein